MIKQMPDRCAFCPSLAKISGEHLWSDWMNDLFPPADRVRFAKVGLDGSVIKEWDMPGLHMKANVVCKPCNEGWMSDIESAAKVAMTDLILGRAVPEITSDQAQAIAIAMFAFKTAVITDRMMAGDFFDISARYSFRTSHSVPPSVMMWLFGMHDLLVSGGTRSRNIYFPNRNRPDLSLNVCSFFIGHFGFQVVSVISDTVQNVESKPVPAGLAIPFHPGIAPNVSWPRPIRLRVEGFDDFAGRWDSIRYK
jgi:hypothetical protein